VSPRLDTSYSQEYISRRYSLGVYKKGGDTMALYNVMFLCSDCGRFHATKISVTVIDGPDRRRQIEEVYSPNATPPEVTELLRTHVMCRVTRNSIKLDRKEFYLVPID
jgi:hypothetical protein